MRIWFFWCTGIPWRCNFGDGFYHGDGMGGGLSKRPQYRAFPVGGDGDGNGGDWGARAPLLHEVKE